jgi:peptidoglycan-N-acetylglucosamine deacetylase
MIRIVKTPGIVKNLFPYVCWEVPGAGKSLYLTFDDGPTAEATPYVLSLLKSYQAKATFFCVGDNIRKNRDQFNDVVSDGHGVGNHTYHHLNGWKTENEEFFENMDRCTDIIKSSGYPHPVLYFRPPHGKLSFLQYKKIRKDYRIVMWDVLSWDFAPGNTPEVLLKRIIQQTVNGSIIVFHDSKKALPGLEIFLEPYLDFFSREGFQFKSLAEIK